MTSGEAAAPSHARGNDEAGKPTHAQERFRRLLERTSPQSAMGVVIEIDFPDRGQSGGRRASRSNPDQPPIDQLVLRVGLDA